MPRPSPALIAMRRQRADAGRRSLGVSWIACATQLDVSPAYLHAILRGQSPGTALWTNLATFLGCTEDWLQDGIGVAPSWGADLPQTAEQITAPNGTMAMLPTSAPRLCGPFPLASVPRSLAAMLPSCGTIGDEQQVRDGAVSPFAVCAEAIPPFAQGTVRVTVAHGHGGDVWPDDTDLICGPPQIGAGSSEQVPSVSLSVIGLRCTSGVVLRLGLWSPWDADVGTLFGLADRQLMWRGRLTELVARRAVHGIVERRRP